LLLIKKNNTKKNYRNIQKKFYTLHQFILKFYTDFKLKINEKS